MDIKSYAMIGISLLVMCGLAVTGRAMVADTDEAAGIASISPAGHQLIKASVIDDAPSHYSIDVRKLANMGADEDAPTFAVYTGNSQPKNCGDFRNLELAYTKPSKYTRVFDLSKHEDVIRAIDKYGCVVMKNIPPAK